MAEIDMLDMYESAKISPNDKIALRNGNESDAVAIKSDQSAEPSVSWLETRENVNKPEVFGYASSVEKSTIKKKHRRRKSQASRWKPYYKLTWEEKKEKDDRETKRANRKREKRFAQGHPVAPYNTTQFLMEDHNVQSPDYLKMISNGIKSCANRNVESSEEYYSMPVDDGELYMQREFCDAYDVINAERLDSMSKNELIQEYLQLEDRIEKLENKLKKCDCETPFRSRTFSSCTIDSEVQTWDMEDDEETEKIRIFQEEIRKLACENAQLKEENRRLLAESETSLQDVDTKILNLDEGCVDAEILNSNVGEFNYKEITCIKSEQSDKENISDSKQCLRNGKCEPSNINANSPLQNHRNDQLF